MKALTLCFIGLLALAGFAAEPSTWVTAAAVEAADGLSVPLSDRRRLELQRRRWLGFSQYYQLIREAPLIVVANRGFGGNPPDEKEHPAIGLRLEAVAEVVQGQPPAKEIYVAYFPDDQDEAEPLAPGAVGARLIAFLTPPDARVFPAKRLGTILAEKKIPATSVFQVCASWHGVLDFGEDSPMPAPSWLRERYRMTGEKDLLAMVKRFIAFQNTVTGSPERKALSEEFTRLGGIYSDFLRDAAAAAWEQVARSYEMTASLPKAEYGAGDEIPLEVHLQPRTEARAPFALWTDFLFDGFDLKLEPRPPRRQEAGREILDRRLPAGLAEVKQTDDACMIIFKLGRIYNLKPGQKYTASVRRYSWDVAERRYRTDEWKDAVFTVSPDENK